MMVRPKTVPNVAKAAVPVAMPRACARWVRTAELPGAQRGRDDQFRDRGVGEAGGEVDG